jgi:hypothetical protein
MAERLAAEQEAALLAVTKRTTAEPWRLDDALGRYGEALVVSKARACVVAECEDGNDAEFIALARNAMPALLSELDTVRAERDSLLRQNDQLHDVAAMLGAVRAERDAIKEAVLAIPLAADVPGTRDEKVARVLKAANAALDIACGVKPRGEPKP